MRRNKSDEFEEYGQEILEAMQENESKAMVDPCYMLDQPELSWAMRQTLITWLVQVHAQYNLQPETLYLAISIIDRISSVRPVTKSHYQLIGTTALWIAAKYEENHGRVPSLKNLAFICTNNYLESEFVATERLMLRLLGFDLGHPTPEAFLKAFHAATECTGDSRASELASAQVLSIARYLMEIGAVAAPAGFFIKRRPSVLATAALHLAEIIFAGSALPNSHAITYSPAVAAAARDPNIMQCVQVLSNLVGKGCEVVRQKYISKTHHEASHIVHGWQRNQVLLAARAAAVPPLLPSSPAAAYRHLYGSHQHYHHHHHHHHRASQQQQQSESSPYFQHHQQQQLLLNPNHHQHQYAADVGVQFPTCPPPGLLTPPKDLIGWGGYTPVHI
ncbi:cyclin-like protein [Geranomyces variabilis]|nr:cyclin-like protein [Geranomyces variabilis]KAJ3140973.1 hypothetical protein HDU90_006994 [Geranomyces variabilis]